MKGQSIKKKTGYYTIIFWLIIVFFIDPGGFLDVYFGSIFERLVTSYGFTLIAYLCYFQKQKTYPIPIIKLAIIRKYLLIMVLWYAYYILWYQMINNDYYPGLIGVILKNSRMFSQGLIVIPLVYFTITSIEYFINLTTKVTISMLVLLFASIITGLQIIKIYALGAVFVEVDRYFMYGDGLIYFSLTIAISMFLLKFLMDKKILISGAFVIVYIFLTFTRRSFIGIFEHVFIISILVSYIYHKSLFSSLGTFFKTKYILYGIVLTIVMSISGASQMHVVQKLAIESVSIFSSEHMNEREDTRLTLTGNTGIFSAIKENFWGGTGFNPLWGTGDGGRNGWEGSDYIFLSCFAMYGLVGILIFIPFYILAFLVIINGLTLLRKNFKSISKHKLEMAPSIIIFLAASSEFLKNIIEYPNWFYPIAFLGGTQQYFIYFGLLIGTFIVIKHNIKVINNITE
jgi:hypothetical protein